MDYHGVNEIKVRKGEVRWLFDLNYGFKLLKVSIVDLLDCPVLDINRQQSSKAEQSLLFSQRKANSLGDGHYVLEHAEALLERNHLLLFFVWHLGLLLSDLARRLRSSEWVSCTPLVERIGGFHALKRNLHALLLT